MALPHSERQAAIEVITNWRASHRYPLNTIQMLLRQRALRVDDRGTVAQRLKRLPSIEGKLHRFPSMNVTQIQDIGGCRAVVSSLPRMRRLQRIFEVYPTVHEIIGCDDYVSTPQDDGYRGVHLVIRHFSESYPNYDRLLIEVQLRSKLQHTWATAVETVDTFQGDSLKLGQGDPKWARFFALMGSVAAREEQSPPVPGTPLKRSALRSEIRELARELDVRSKLVMYRSALKTLSEPGVKGSHLFLLTLRPGEGDNGYLLEITGYPEEERELADRDYAETEARFQSQPGADVVLVAVQSLQKLRRAYPNYFLDTSAFLQLLGTATR